MRKIYLLSKWLVSNKSQQLSLTYISENQPEKVWKLKRVLVGKNFRDTCMKWVAKDSAVQGRKKLSVCSYTKKSLLSLSLKIRFLYCASENMILYYFIFLFFLFLVSWDYFYFFFNWAIAKLIVSCFVGYYCWEILKSVFCFEQLLEIVTVFMGTNHMALKIRITKLREIFHSVRLVKSLHTSDVRSELVMSWSL